MKSIQPPIQPFSCGCDCACNTPTGLGNDKHTRKLKQDINNWTNNYGLSTSVEPEEISAGHVMLGSSNSQPRNVPESWNMLRRLPLDLPLDIQTDLYLDYQSEDDTTSEDDCSNSGVTRCDTAGATNRRLSENEVLNRQDLPSAEHGSDNENQDIDEYVGSEANEGDQ